MSSQFGFHEFINLAKQLSSAQVASKNTENILRLVANRVYYGAFHGTKQYLNLCEQASISNDGVSHEHVWGRFRGSGRGAFHQWRRQVHQASKALKEFREWADYDNPDRLIPADASEIWERFSDLQIAIQKLEEYKPCESALWILEVSTPATPNGPTKE